MDALFLAILTGYCMAALVLTGLAVILLRHLRPSVSKPATAGLAVAVFVAVIMFVPIGFDKEIVKTQIEPVIETEEVLEVSTIGTMLVTGSVTGEAHLTRSTTALGSAFSLIAGLASWAAWAGVAWSTKRLQTQADHYQ